MNLVNIFKNKKKKERIPIWIMRQAGRYLPEFRKLKKKSGGFMNMLYSPRIASDITLQPIRRFGLDAAIIFSDILTIPDSLGQKLTYEEGKGPSLERMTIDQMINDLSINKKQEKLNSVYKAIKETKKKLNKNVKLIGFVGAPLTVSLFMFGGKKNKQLLPLKILKERKQKTKRLYNLLEKAIADHAIKQLNAGADIIQIFDTWACLVKGKDLEFFSINPIKRICTLIKSKKPKKHIIVFPRNVSTSYTKYIYKHIDCISVGEDIKDYEIKKIQEKKTIQGNLSPKALFSGGKNLEKEIRKVLKKFSKKPFIFNLSHGIMPGTPLRNVQKLIDVIRGYKNEV